MRREPRCEHLFLMGLCREPGCPHEEQGRVRAQRRVKPRKCKRCGGAATINIQQGGSNWRCEGCHSIMTPRVGARRALWLLPVLLLGCGGVDVPKIPTPGTCGFWEELRVIEAGPSECIWAASNNTDVVFVPIDECPGPNEPTCVIVLPGEPFQAWGEISRPPSAAISERYDLLEDGSCPVSCEAEYGCIPLEEEPTLCVPCTAEEPCL